MEASGLEECITAEPGNIEVDVAFGGASPGPSWPVRRGI
jgi:hypothetical protein